jgi:Leucine-rich repeat (LRR) protein
LEGDTLPENLLSLNLQGNYLTSLDKGVLAGKKYLQHLNLAKNKLKELPPAGVSWPILTFLNANGTLSDTCVSFTLLSQSLIS